MILKDNSPKLLIAAIITIILQTGILTGIALNTAAIKRDQELTLMIARDYVPMWFMEGMIKSMNYQTEEIVATINGNDEKIKEINARYIKLQNIMINNIIQMREGMTNITRKGEK